MAIYNTITNFPVTPRDVKISNKIFGFDVPSMKGKPVRRQPEAVFNDYLEIPREILSMNAGLEVSVDVMFVNKLAFLVSVRKRPKSTTIEYIPNRLERELFKSVNFFKDVYKNEASQCILLGVPTKNTFCEK